MAELTNAEKLARARTQLAKYKEKEKGKNKKTKKSTFEINGEKYSQKELKDIAEREILSKERERKVNLSENRDLRNFEEQLKLALVAGVGYGWIKKKTGLFSLIPKFTDYAAETDVAVGVVLYAIATRTSLANEWKMRIMALALQAVSSAAQTVGGSFDGLDDVAKQINSRIGVGPQAVAN